MLNAVFSRGGVSPFARTWFRKREARHLGFVRYFVSSEIQPQSFDSGNRMNRPTRYPSNKHLQLEQIKDNAIGVTRPKKTPHREEGALRRVVAVPRPSQLQAFSPARHKVRELTECELSSGLPVIC